MADFSPDLEFPASPVGRRTDLVIDLRIQLFTNRGSVSTLFTGVCKDKFGVYKHPTSSSVLNVEVEPTLMEKIALFLKYQGVVVSILVLTCSILILLGWLFQIPFLQNPFPDSVKVAPSTAIAFILSATSLLFVTGFKTLWCRVLSTLCAVTVSMIGLGVLCNFLNLGADFDQMFHGTPLPVGASGRMAIATSINFVLLGLCLITNTCEVGRFARTVAQFFCLGILCISLFTLSGGVDNHLSAKTTLQMAVPTSILFSMLALSLLLLRSDQSLFRLMMSNTAGGKLIRWLLPIVVIAPPLISRLRMLLQQLGLFDTATGSAITSVVVSIFMGSLIYSFASKLDSAEQENRRQEQLRDTLSAIVESSEDAIVSKNLEGVIQTWNPGAQRLFGFEPDEAIGKEVSVIVPEDRIDEELEILDKLKRGERIEHFETKRLTKNGEVIDVSLTISPVKDFSGRVVGASKIARDISQRKRSEKVLEETRRELELLNGALASARDQAIAASKLKSEFVANMSHEIRTPMNGIIGMCNVLLKTHLDEKQQEYATAIKEAGRTLLTVINDILDFSKIEAGKMELEIIDFDPVRTVEGSCHLLAMAAKSKRLSLMTFVDPKLPKLLRGDPERIKQILINLANNSIKFSDDGEVVVRVVLESSTEKTVCVRFEVRDSGIGLTEEEQTHLFKPFVQADGSISRRYGGTGLGLSICKRLIELMGGNIGVESVKGKGSLFWFTLTLEKRSNTPVISVMTEIRDVKILIVDNHQYTREILHTYAVSWGMRNGVAASGNDAIALLRKASADGEEYKVVIINLSLPDMDGIETAKKIQSDPAISKTKLILLTEFDTTCLGSQALEAGFKGFLTKPVKQSHMLDCISKVICGTSQIDELTATSAEIKAKKLANSSNGMVLIVEDHPINQQIAQAYLEELGLVCHIATDGIEAIEAVKKTNYDLVLMDCQMPHMDGFEATSAIRRVEALTGKRTPIIAVTAHAMDGDRDKCISAGMDDYISKPIEPATLTSIVRNWIPSPQTTKSARRSRLLPVKGAPVDLEAITNRYRSEEHRKKLATLFIHDVPKQIDALKAAADEQDKRQVLQVAHGLKGVCAVMYAVEMRKTCTEIETVSEAHDWSSLDSLIGTLKKQLEETTAFLEATL